MTTADHVMLVRAALDQPWRARQRLVLADWYEDHGREAHARLLRATAGHSWRFHPLDQHHLHSWSFDGDPAPRAATLWVAFDRREGRRHPDRQPWRWRLTRPGEYLFITLGRHHARGEVGRSPNRHNAMRRALLALLVHRRRACPCEGHP